MHGWLLSRGLAGSGREAFLDMRPFMFRAPLLMQQGASLTRALSLFRQMGLHHILIAPPDPRAVGFVTRKVGPRPCLLMRSACTACFPNGCHAMAVSLLVGMLITMLSTHLRLLVLCSTTGEAWQSPVVQDIAISACTCIMQDLAMENAKLARLRKRRSAAEHGEDLSANGVRKEMNGAHGMAPQELC